MAESQSMTTAEVVAKTLISEHADFLREAVAMVATQLMEAEISSEIGAARGEVSADRATHRNGYRDRRWETRVGEIDLLVPRKRSGEAYFPSFLEPRRPAEQAIVAVVMEAYVNGVSTRKVDHLVEQLGIHSMTKDRVSALCRALDERVEAFRNRPSGGRIPVSLARRQAPSGQRPRPRSLEGPRRRLRGPRDRAPRGDRDRPGRGRDRGLLGRVPALAQSPRARRCPSCGLRSPRGPKGGDRPDPRLSLAALHRPLRPQHAGALPALGSRDRRRGAARDLRRGGARASQRRLGEVVERFREPLPKIAELLEGAEEDLVAFYRFPAAHWPKLRSTNPLERLNKEIGRRSDVVGIFPNDASAIRLTGALLIEQNDEWLVCRRYLSEESLALVLEDQGDEGKEVAELQAA